MVSVHALSLSGHGTDYLNLALRDGGVSLTMGLANGKQEMHIKPSKVRFDDHQWHKVTVHRRIQEISSITSFCRVSCAAASLIATPGVADASNSNIRYRYYRFSRRSWRHHFNAFAYSW